MLEGMYTAAAGMAAQQDRLDAVAGDLANVSTTGYKQPAWRSATSSTPTAGTATQRAPRLRRSGDLAARGTAQGALNETGEPLDVALQGQGFIAVRTAAGKPALTRDGTLRLDDRGRLTTATGQLSTRRSPSRAGPSPTTSRSPATAPSRSRAGRPARSASSRSPPRPASPARRTTSSLQPPRAAPRPRRRAPPASRQGALEASNVDVGEAMTSMIEAQRGFELASKAIEVQDQMLQIANQVKR